MSAAHHHHGAAPRRTRRWLPHPLLSLAMTGLWMLLLNDFSLGGLLMGGLLGVAIPLLTAGFWPEPLRIRSYSKAIAYILLVLWDIAVANVQVARLILFRPVKQLNTRWIAIPLELSSPEAITLLAGTITMTPGTVSCDLSADGRTLLVHCLDAPDADAAVRDIKQRYESRIKEILE